MTPFFITGLPRSRTAWLSNLLTTEDSICHHDLLGQVASFDGFCAAIRQEGRVMGDSDSGLLFAYPQVEQAFPDARWVVVRRNPDEAWASLKRFTATGPWRSVLNLTPEVKAAMERGYGRAAAHFANHPRCLNVEFHDLGKSEAVKAVWRHCLPEVFFDDTRANMLQALRIEVRQEARPLTIQSELARELAATH